MIKYMGKMKKVFDPNGILNPYKVLPDTAVEWRPVCLPIDLYFYKTMTFYYAIKIKFDNSIIL